MARETRSTEKKKQAASPNSEPPKTSDKRPRDDTDDEGQIQEAEAQPTPKKAKKEKKKALSALATIDEDDMEDEIIVAIPKKSATQAGKGTKQTNVIGGLLQPEPVEPRKRKSSNKSDAQAQESKPAPKAKKEKVKPSSSSSKTAQAGAGAPHQSSPYKNIPRSKPPHTSRPPETLSTHSEAQNNSTPTTTRPPQTASNILTTASAAVNTTESRESLLTTRLAQQEAYFLDRTDYYQRILLRLMNVDYLGNRAVGACFIMADEVRRLVVEMREDCALWVTGM